MESISPYRRMMALNAPLAELEANKMRLNGVAPEILERVDFWYLAVTMIGAITRATQFGGRGASYSELVDYCRDACRAMVPELSDDDIDLISLYVHERLANKSGHYKHFMERYYCFDSKKSLDFQFSLVTRVHWESEGDVFYKITQDGAALYYDTMMSSIPTEEEVTNAIMNYMINIGDYAGAGAYAEKIIVECVRHQEQIKEAFEQVRDDVDTPLDEILEKFERANRTISDRMESQRTEKEKLQEIVLNLSDREKVARARELITKLETSEDYRTRLLVDILKKRDALLAMKGAGLCRRAGSKAKVLWQDMLMKPVCSAGREVLGKQLDAISAATFMLKIPDMDLVADAMASRFLFLEKEEENLNRPLRESSSCDETEEYPEVAICEEGHFIENVAHEVREDLVRKIAMEKTEITLSHEINSVIDAGYSPEHVLHFSYILYSLILGDSNCSIQDVDLPRFHNEYLEGTNAVISIHGDIDG